jgi:hypothetical protein
LRRAAFAGPGTASLPGLLRICARQRPGTEAVPGPANAELCLPRADPPLCQVSFGIFYISLHVIYSSRGRHNLKKKKGRGKQGVLREVLGLYPPTVRGMEGTTSPFLKKKKFYREEDVWREVVGLYPRTVRGRYSIDLPYEYKSTDTDAEGRGEADTSSLRSCSRRSLPQFTCLTSTTVQILTQKDAVRQAQPRHGLARVAASHATESGSY